MKTLLKLITLGLLVTFFISCNKDDDDVCEMKKDLTLNLTGLEELGSDFVYEGWLIVSGGAVSTGTFSSVDFPQTFSVCESKLESATKFVLTIEPANDSDPSASSVHILAGDFNGGVTAMTSTDIIGDFSTISGKYILATPTNGSMTNENSGIWFLDPSSGAPLAGLDLPTLPEGWVYEGWTVIDGTPVTTGKFTKIAASDMFNGFSGTMALPMPNGTDGFFPGEDFLNSAPAGLSFPTDIAGGKAVISIEPSPDNSPMPFALKPLVGMIPADATDHTVYNMNTNTANFPGGSVSR